MSISFPSADFAPTLSGYTGQGAFRFWCQKVLPIVYDDSLSYYELLNKVVNYLNNVISDVASVEENIGKLNDSYAGLQNYVNDHMQELVSVVNVFTNFVEDYFENLDVQTEINNKLDSMASDGSLTSLISPLVALVAPDIITNWLNENITPTEPPIDASLTVSGAGADAKVTGDLFKYFKVNNNAVLSRLSSPNYENISPLDSVVVGYYIKRETGHVYTGSKFAYIGGLSSADRDIVTCVDNDYKYAVVGFSDSNVGESSYVREVTNGWTDSNVLTLIGNDTPFFAVEVRHTDDSDISSDETVKIRNAFQFFDTSSHDAKYLSEKTDNLTSRVFSANGQSLPGADSLQLGKYINRQTGRIYSGARFARSVLLDTHNRKAVTFTQEGYKYSVVGYSTYVANESSFTGEITDGWTDVNVITPVPDNVKYVCVQVVKLDGTQIAEEERDSIFSGFVFYDISNTVRRYMEYNTEQKIITPLLHVIEGLFMYNTTGQIATTKVDTRIVYFECAQNTRYYVENTLGTRLILGCFTSVPRVGDIPTTMVLGKQSNLQPVGSYIVTDSDSVYLAIYCYTANFDSAAPLDVIRGLKIVANPDVSESPIYYTNDDNVEDVTTFNGVVSLYDKLCKKYPDFIKKYTRHSGSKTNYEYVLNDVDYNDVDAYRTPDSTIARPVVLITSGIHGYERSAVTSLYSFIKDLCSNSKKILDSIKYLPTIKIIPVGCPWGYDNNSRLNENGVNINRNFASSTWSQTPTGNNYSGASPGDQDDTKIIQDWMDENNNAVMYLDFHNSSMVNEISCMIGLNSDYTAPVKKKYLMAINNIIDHWIDKRGILKNNILSYTGRGNLTAGGTSTSYAREQGVNIALTMEFSWNVCATGLFSNFTIGVGAEAIGNTLLNMKEYFEI